MPGILLQNKYRIEDVIGRGGMGKVYLARDTNTLVTYAIKQNIINTTGNQREVIIERIKREYYFLSKIQHRNVIKAHDFFIENQQYFLVVEYVPGLSLKEFIEQKKHTLSLAEQLCVAIQVCRALETINMIGLVHRDIKPSNIIINEKEHVVKLLDLGIAKAVSSKLQKITEVNSLLGTVNYMSPEQLNGHVEKNTDIFSLGIVFYQFFLWQDFSPFHASSPAISMEKIQSSKIPRLSTQVGSENQMYLKYYEKISAVIEKMLEKDSVSRTQSAGEVAESLYPIYQEIIKKFPQKSSWKPTNNSSIIEKRKLINLGNEYEKYYQRKPLLEKYKAKKTYKLIYFTTFIFMLIISSGAWLYFGYQQQVVEKYLQKSIDAYQQKKYEDVLAYCDRAQEIERRNTNINTLEVLTLHFLGKEKELITSYIQQNFYSLLQEQDLFSLYAIGVVYKYGIGEITQNNSLAKKYFRLAAEKEYTLAVWELIDSLEKESNSTIEYISWLEIEGYRGNITAIRKLVKHYFDHNNKDSLIYWIKQEPSTKDPFCMYYYGKICEQEKEYELYKSIMIKCAEQKFSLAYVDLIKIHQMGIGTSVDIQEAIVWGVKAIEIGYVPAILYAAQIAKLHSKESKAIELYKAAANLENAEAYRQLGYIYHHSSPPDFEKTFFYMEKAATLGDIAALCNIGSMYASGAYVKQDFQKAFDCFQKAANVGYSGGMYNLAIMYERGDGVQRDPQKSIEWLEKGAEAGDTNSMTLLGEYYILGYIVSKNEEKAVYWLEKAKNAGSERAKQILEHKKE